MDDKIPILVIVGPTASGKTALAVQMGKIYSGEVVSADSMQIYKGLSIATAKPTLEEIQGVKHHLIDFVEPDKPFSAADYVKLAKKEIIEIHEKGKLPIICGGTGLYISSLIDGVKFEAQTAGDMQVRQSLYKMAQQKGNHYMWQQLEKVDKITAQKVHENNLVRVVRALEVYEITGTPLSQHQINSRSEQSPYKSCIIGLTAANRQYLYDRIDLRVDNMVKDGLVEECRQVWQEGKLSTAAQAIGYKELIAYFESKASLEQCIDKIKQQTRHYAKRQLTWFRKMDKISWIEIDNFDNMKKIIEKVNNIVAKSEIMCYNINYK